MSRSVQTPAVSTRTIDRFFGMVSDRSGVELEENEFTDLTNYRVDYLRRLKVRNGAKKFNGLTHTGSANPVLGLDRFVAEDASVFDLKIVNTVLYKSDDGAAWASLQTGLTAANTFFASTLTKKTGAAADETDTVDSSSATTVTATSLAMTIGEHVNKILVINNENKRIVANTATKITVGERFEVTPSSGDSFTVVDSQKEVFFANGTNFFKSDGTTNTQLDNSVYAYAFDGVTEHMSRLWGWKDQTVYYSDIGVGEHYSRNALFGFGSNVQVAKPMGDVIVFWEANRVTAIEGDNPDNFRQIPASSNRGTTAPFSVATWNNMQFGLNEDVGVMIITASEINPGGPEPVSVSDEYITVEMLAHTTAELDAACAEVADSKYHITIGTDKYTLHIRESFKAPRDDAGNIRWIWTKDDYPTGLDANVMRLLGTQLAVGSDADGQIYEYDADSQFDDDGTVIAGTIEKQDWRPRKEESQIFFWSLKVRQTIAAAALNMNYFADPDGTTYGSAIQTIDINAASSNLHEVKFTSNPNDEKAKGNTISYKITSSTSITVPAIEEIHLLYVPNPVG